MLKFFSTLSVFCIICLSMNIAKADSFLLANQELYFSNQNDHIIPLLYIKELEFYNHKKTSAFTQRITDKLSLEPKIIITDDEKLADYYIIPRLLQSNMAPLNQEASRYSMSVKVELWSKGDILVDTVQQNRYIVIEHDKDAQQVAKKLLFKLLDEALTELMYKLK